MKHTGTKAAKERETFARVYGSAERVAWMRRQPCLVCSGLPSENAHTRSGGTGRKGDADSIVPLCHYHHAQLHRVGVKSFQTDHAINFFVAALRVDARYEAFETWCADNPESF